MASRVLADIVAWLILKLEGGTGVAGRGRPRNFALSDAFLRMPPGLLLVSPRIVDKWFLKFFLLLLYRPPLIFSVIVKGSLVPYLHGLVRDRGHSTPISCVRLVGVNFLLSARSRKILFWRI
jgi:hypothetical protein